MTEPRYVPRPSGRIRTAHGAAPLASTLALALLAACAPPGADSDGESVAAGSGDDTPAFEGGIERERATRVLTAPLVQREMVRALSTTVNAVSAREVPIIPRTAGVVTEVLVEEGDRVAQDDVLMKLDPRMLEAALEEARIAEKEARDALAGLTLAVTEAAAQESRAQLTYDQSTRELARKEDAADVVSRNELDQLRLTVQTNAADLEAQNVAKQRAETALVSQQIAIERAVLQVQRAELDLSFVQVTAPFDGVVASRDVREGDNISAGTPAFTLTDTDNVRAVVSRPQREWSFFRAAEARARAAQPDAGGAGDLDIEILPEAIPDHAYAGNILFTSPTIDAASGQFGVTLGIDQPEAGDDRPPVLPGMLLRVRIVTERHPDALVVPKRALLREGETHFVFVADEDRARKVEVDEGFSDDDHVEVLPTEEGALEPGDEIVVVGNRDLEDGDSIQPEPWPGAQRPDAPEGEDDGAPEGEGDDGSADEDAEAPEAGAADASEDGDEDGSTDGNDAADGGERPSDGR